MFALPELEKMDEFISPSEVDPQLICNDQNALISSKSGPFGLLALATENLTEQTAVFFRVYKGHDRYIILMCSDQSRSIIFHLPSIHFPQVKPLLLLTASHIY